MNKMTRFLPLVLAALLSWGLASCGDDGVYCDDGDGYYAGTQDDRLLMANTLRGHWRGKTVARFRDASGMMREEVYDTDIEFDQYDVKAYSGRGRQLDYLGEELVYDRIFTWRIQQGSGDIIMVYDGENGQKFQMVIRYNDLKLDEHTFSGVQTGDGETDEFAYNRYTYAKKMVFEME